MKERLLRLMAVKSIVTIVLTFVFAYLSVSGKVDSGQFITIFTVVVSFYFGTQVDKVSSVLSSAATDEDNES